MAPPGTGLPEERSIELWDAVRALPPRARTAIALRYAAGLSEAEVATAMNVAVGTGQPGPNRRLTVQQVERERGDAVVEQCAAEPRRP